MTDWFAGLSQPFQIAVAIVGALAAAYLALATLGGVLGALTESLGEDGDRQFADRVRRENEKSAEAVALYRAQAKARVRRHQLARIATAPMPASGEPSTSLNDDALLG
jgi:membrane protein YqaA with SNARE-associated domain